MKWTDPEIKLVASAVSDWQGQIIERTQLLLEQAEACLIICHCIGMSVTGTMILPNMAVSAVMEERLTAYEGCCAPPAWKT